MDTDATGSTRQQASQQAAGLADQLRSKTSDALSQQKTRATQGIGSVVEAIRQTGRQLGEGNQSGIATYVNNAADSLQRWTETFDRKDVGEIVEDVQRFGRRQPALFVGLSFGLGLLSARFLKSSSDRQTYGGASYSGPDRDTGWAARTQAQPYTAQRATGLVRDVNYGEDSAGPRL